MRCAEFQEIMRSFLDGEVAGDTRREVGRHLADCTDCAQLIEEDRFWNDALRSHLDRELPPDLRDSILGDLAPYASDASESRRNGTLDNLGWRKQWQIAWWAIRRDLLRPRGMLQAAALAVVVILVLNYVPFFRSSDSGPAAAAFGSAGPIVQVDQDAAWSSGETVPTARLTLSGRLI